MDFESLPGSLFDMKGAFTRGVVDDLHSNCGHGMCSRLQAIGVENRLLFVDAIVEIIPGKEFAQQTHALSITCLHVVEFIGIEAK